MMAYAMDHRVAVAAAYDDCGSSIEASASFDGATDTELIRRLRAGGVGTDARAGSYGFYVILAHPVEQPRLRGTFLGPAI